ncbi:MAG: hypothetical protein QXH39_00935 [Conexivisphaerales archaeon]
MPIDISWHDYNEALVERGSMILYSWREELREMNGSNKVGSCTRIRTSNSPRTSRLALTYRTVQGITRSLSEYIKIHARNTLYQYNYAVHGEEKEVRADHGYK